MSLVRNLLKLRIPMRIVAVLLAAIVATDTVYQASNPNAGMLNCPPGTYQVLILCYDLSCGRFLLFLFGILMAIWAIFALICAYVNRNDESQRRMCWALLETLSLMTANLIAAMFLFLCPI